MEQAVILSKKDFQALKGDIKTLQSQVASLLDNPVTVEWYSVSQAAKALNRHPCTVRDLCKEGKLEFKQGKRKMEISVKSIQQYISSKIIK